MIQENYKYTELTSGLRVISESLPHVNSFSLGFWINTGSRNETSENNGISHFTEHMLFKGTQKRTSRRIADEVESLGGYLNAFTSKEHTCYYGRGLGQHLPKVFDVVSDVLQNSVFKQSEISKESGVIVDELYDIEDSPEELIFDKFESNLYRGNSLHFPIIGTEDNIRAFQHEDFKNYIQSYYTPDKMVISASGEVDHNQLVALIEGSFKSNNRIVEKKSNKPRSRKTVDINILKEIQQSHVIIGRRSAGYSSKERIKVNLISHILGEGSSSRLFHTLREKNGMTYQINTFLNSFSDVSTFGIYFSTGDNTLNSATELVYKELDKVITKGITKREFIRAKEYLKGQLLMHLESTTNRMVRMAQSVLYFNKVKLVQKSLDEINAITLDEIESISKKLLDGNKFSKVVLSSNNI